MFEITRNNRYSHKLNWTINRSNCW